MVVRAEQRLSVWQLPSISGRLWWPFLAIWSACFGLAVLGGFFYARDDLHLSPATENAFGFIAKSPFATGDPMAGSVVWVVLSSEARTSGVRANDRVLSINGRRPDTDERPLDTTWAALGRPSAIMVEVVSLEGHRARHRLTYSRAHAEEGVRQSGLSFGTWRAIRAAAMLVIATLVPLVFAWLLLAKRWREPLAPWASLALVLSAVTSGAAERASALREVVPTGVWHVLDVDSVLPLLLTLTLFPDGRVTRRWMWLVIAVDLLFAFHPLFGLSLNITNLIIGVGFVAPVMTMASKYRDMPAGDGRQQIRWIVFCLFVATMLFFVGVALQAVVFHTEAPGRFVLFDLASVIVFEAYTVFAFVGLTIGLMRYRLYDADATISQSVVYGVLTLGLLAIFAASEKLIELMGEHYLGERLGAMAGAIGAATAAVMIVPLHHRVTHWTEKRFRGGLAKLRYGLPLLVGDMRETASPREVADAALLRVEAGVRASHGAVVAHGNLLDVRDIEDSAVSAWMNAGTLDGSVTSLRCDLDDNLFPVQLPLHADGPGLVGWLLLGPRPDGSLYGRAEREALSEIADPVARALAIAIERERRDADRKIRDDHVDRELQDLREFVREHLRPPEW